MRRLLLLALAVGLAASLSACGRKSAPRPPEGTEYPHVYPYTPFPGEVYTGGWGTGQSPQRPAEDQEGGPELRQPTQAAPLDHPNKAKP